MMSEFSAIPNWALAVALVVIGLAAGWLLGHAHSARSARRQLRLREQELHSQAEREHTLWQGQVTQLRADLQSLQQQALRWREALDQARDERAQWQERSQRVAPLEARLLEQMHTHRETQDALARLQADHAALSALHEEQGVQAAERLQFLEQTRSSLQAQFQQLANAILEEKSTRFMQQNQQHLGQLLDPLRQRLQEFQGRVEQFYDAEGKQRAALAQQVHDLLGMNQRLSDDARQLAQALKGSTKTQGTWGETLLQKILEQAGLREGVDYQAQANHVREDGSRAQPDIIIHLPQQRHVVIDAKVSLTAYARWMDMHERQTADARADDGTDHARRTALRQHIASLRTHVRQLAERSYQQLHSLQSLDFVILFVPIEPAFLLALSEDERLQQDAWERNVLLVSPSTLLFVLRTIAHLWRQEAQTRNAQDIARRGAELYDKLVDFVGEMDKVGQQLTLAQQSHQKAMHRLAGQKGNVIRQAEQLKALGVQPSKALPASLSDAGDEDDEGDRL